jgi:hypothetical protein
MVVILDIKSVLHTSFKKKSINEYRYEYTRVFVFCPMQLKMNGRNFACQCQAVFIYLKVRINYPGTPGYCTVQISQHKYIKYTCWFFKIKKWSVFTRGQVTLKLFSFYPHDLVILR